MKQLARGLTKREDLLWTNPSPKSAMSTNILLTNISYYKKTLKYDYLKIAWKQQASDTNSKISCNMFIAVPDLPTMARSLYASAIISSKTYLRGVSIAQSQELVDGAYKNSYYLTFDGTTYGLGHTGKNTSACIPYQVFGVKYE